MTTQSSSSNKAPSAGRQSRWPLIVTWAATGAALVLGLVPRFMGSATYDPMIALTVAGSIGLAWYTYFTRQGVVDARTREENSRNAQRSSVATALLAELQSVVGRLRAVSEHGMTAATPDFISAPVLELACERPELFTTPTVQSLLGLRRRLRDVQIFLEECKKLRVEAANQTLPDQQLTLARLSEHTESLKVRAGWAYNVAVGLVEMLRLEGGQMPSPSELPVTSSHEVALLQNPFEDEP